MIVYVYDNNRKSNKKATFKNVSAIISEESVYSLYTPDGKVLIEKNNIKLVIYGF